jgi:hypothetical protein
MNSRNISKDSGRAIANPGEPMLKGTSDGQRSVGMTEALQTEGQFAPERNRTKDGNVVDRENAV